MIRATEVFWNVNQQPVALFFIQLLDFEFSDRANWFEPLLKKRGSGNRFGSAGFEERVEERNNLKIQRGGRLEGFIFAKVLATFWPKNLVTLLAIDRR